MQDGRNLAVLAVICSLALCIKVAAENPLDMAPDAVDDMFDGCTKDALNTFVFSDLLQEELNKSTDFQEAWSKSESFACPRLIPGGLEEHTTALRTIVSDDTLEGILNKAVYTLGINATTYEDHFHFKSFHFLLMDSIRLLYTGLPNCTTVYALIDLESMPLVNSTVRLGSFLHGYSSLETLKKHSSDIYDESVLSITTCYFANLGDNICNKEPVILLSPTEEFTVEDVKYIQEEDTSYRLIVLKHSQLKSMHNCYIFSRSPYTSSHWLFLALLTPSFFIII